MVHHHHLVILYTYVSNSANMHKKLMIKIIQLKKNHNNNDNINENGVTNKKRDLNDTNEKKTDMKDEKKW